MARFVYLLYQVPDDATLDDLLPGNEECREFDYGIFPDDENLSIESYRLMDDDDNTPYYGEQERYLLYLAQWISNAGFEMESYEVIPQSPKTFAEWKKEEK
jgi:hypothetical protein